MRSEMDVPQLSEEFVDSLRVLFDILDTRRNGRVSYEILCSQFAEGRYSNLPPNFLAYIGKVTPPDGYLTFERFLAAVRLSLVEVNNNELPTRTASSVRASKPPTYENPANLHAIHRVHSEGKLNQAGSKRMYGGPAMGVNVIDRRSQIYSSQPSLVQQNHYASQPSIAQYHATPYAPTSNCMPSNNYEQHSQVVLRKKGNTVRSAKEESRMRHPQPPSVVPSGTPRVQVIRSRPQSTASYNSVASSGLENIAWRHSTASHSTSDLAKRDTASSEEENAPRVAKLESLHKEEEALIKRGVEATTKLTAWYNERLESIEKRERLLKQGMVALDAAVHEQKMNFLRAHITELNRRIVALMETSERGFPTHVNLQKNNLPQPQDDQLLWLHRQNHMLNQELGDKTRLIEDMRKDKENYSRVPSSVSRVIQPTRVAAQVQRPSAFVRPAFQTPTVRSHSSSASGSPPVKVYDTLM